MNKKEPVYSENCPLCNEPNNCGNLSSNNEACWCMDKNVMFPESLLRQVVDSAKNKACICQACTYKHKDNSVVIWFVIGIKVDTLLYSCIMERNVIELILLLLIYSSIWFVPLSINVRRRKNGQRPYWGLFVVTLLLEIGVVYLVLYAGQSSSYKLLVALLGPVIASILAAAFYLLLARAMDAKSTSSWSRKTPYNERLR